MLYDVVEFNAIFVTYIWLFFYLFNNPFANYNRKNDCIKYEVKLCRVNVSMNTSIYPD